MPNGREREMAPEMRGRGIFDLAGMPPRREVPPAREPAGVPPEGEALIPLMEEFRADPEGFIRNTMQRLAVLGLAMPTIRSAVDEFFFRMREAAGRREEAPSPPVRRRQGVRRPPSPPPPRIGR